MNIKKIPIVALVLSNLVPLVGIFMMKYSVFDIIAVYVAETGVIAFYTIIKIFFAKKESSPHTQILGKPANMVSKVTVVFVFIISFSFFLLLQTFFVLSLFKENSIEISRIWLSVFALFVSHGISLIQNYFIAGDREHSAPDEFFIPVFIRIFISQAVVIGGAQLFLVMLAVFGPTVAAQILLVSIKIIADIARYMKEHKTQFV